MLLQKTRDNFETKRNTGVLDEYVVIVQNKGEISALTSAGADMDTLFDVASTGKVLITSTLILKAIGEQKLALDDTLDKFFPAMPDDKKGITVFHLLTHTSGILRHNIPKSICAMKNDSIAEFILSKPLGFPIGSQYTYSCTGYILLGFIAEKALHAPLDELYYSYIKQPLGLTRSGFNIGVDEDNAVNCCYSRKEMGQSALADELVMNMRGGIAGNGGSFWSANDYLKWVKAIYNKEEIFYKEPMFAMAEKNYTPTYGEGRGLGYLIVDETYKQTGKLFPAGSFGHCGHSGVSFFINREKELFVIILSNITRCTYRNLNWQKRDYNITKRFREDVHNAIWDDLQL